MPDINIAPALEGRRLGSPRRLLPLGFVGPALALLAGLRVWPMLQAFYLSFTSWDGISSPEWIGTKNFAYLFHDPIFKQALVDNLLLLLAIPVWVILPFLIAATLHERVPGWRFFRAAFFLPALLSPVIIGVFFSIMLRQDGAINEMLRSVGLGALANGWLTESSSALIVLGAIIVWASFGIGVLIYLAALSTLDSELVDAARLDGASWLQVQRHVVFWQILPVAEFWSVVVLISIFTGLFPYVLTLTNGGPGYATYILDFDIYMEGFGGASGAAGYASAVGVVLFLIVLVLSVIQLRLFRRRADV
jgi:ABC-type sugar transport system permease subunit